MGDEGSGAGASHKSNSSSSSSSSRKKARRWKSDRLDPEGGERRVCARVTGAARAWTAKAEINDVESSNAGWNKAHNATGSYFQLRWRRAPRPKHICYEHVTTANIHQCPASLSSTTNQQRQCSCVQSVCKPKNFSPASSVVSHSSIAATGLKKITARLLQRYRATRHCVLEMFLKPPTDGQYYTTSWHRPLSRLYALFY